jgi:hypothetical protein
MGLMACSSGEVGEPTPQSTLEFDDFYVSTALIFAD